VLSTEILDREFFRDLDVGVGAPFGIIYAIHDADHAVAAASRNAIESVAKFGSLNLLRVFGADGGQIIGKNQAAFQIIYSAKILQAAGMKRSRGNSRTVNDIASKDSLVAMLWMVKITGQFLASGSSL